MNCTGTLPISGQATPCKRIDSRIEEAEQQAGEHRRHRPPFGEDQRRQRDEALAGGHVLDEAGVLGDRQIGAGDAAEHAGADHRAVAQPGHRDAGGVDRGRVLADGAQPQAEAGAEQHPPGERHHQEGEIDEDRMAGDQLANRSGRGPARPRIASAPGSVDRLEARPARTAPACGRPAGTRPGRG